MACQILHTTFIHNTVKYTVIFTQTNIQNALRSFSFIKFSTISPGYIYIYSHLTRTMLHDVYIHIHFTGTSTYELHQFTSMQKSFLEFMNTQWNQPPYQRDFRDPQAVVDCTRADVVSNYHQFGINHGRRQNFDIYLIKFSFSLMIKKVKFTLTK